ncbi:MAG TPA: sigma-70 family RNA polymerase sigma factor [Chitinophagaceae bacterium]|nr:sigma-70 family RNA polymerase sigma factor [Chitinophagaceae bacterium]
MLYRSFYKAMMNICLRYTKNEADAMEALNGGFYKVLKHIDRFDSSKASLYTWVRAIIIRSCLDLVNRNKNMPATAELEQAGDVHILPNVVSGMSATEILKLVRELPPATQAVFNLYNIEGYSHKEIAGLMSISEGTSKWHLSEARKKMQQMLNKRSK